jgi:hypothetical protein
MPFSVARDGGSDGVSDEEIEEVRAEARHNLLGALEEHAAWCKSVKLYLERDLSYRRILTLDPDHETARRGLGYRRERDGSWREPSSTHREPKNYTPKKVAKARERFAEVLELYSAHLHAFLEQEREELSPAQRDRILKEILAGDPDDERARAQMGEVRSGEAWVLKETAAARVRRKELSKLVRDLVKAAPAPKKVAADAREKKLGVNWTTILAIPGFRATTTVGQGEAKLAVQAVQVMQVYFNTLFGTRAKLGSHCTLFLLDGPAEKGPLIDNHPSLAPHDREFLKTLVGGGFSGSTDLGHWGESGKRRVDGIVRIALGHLFADAYGITTQEAWVYEGFGLYLTYQVLRSRLTWFVQPSAGRQAEEEAVLRGRLLDPETNWMQEAHTLLQGESRPRLSGVLAGDVNGLTTEELLFSYVIAAYLLEARPESAPEILQRVGGGMDSALALTGVLGIDLEALDAHILRWLSERK